LQKIRCSLHVQVSDSVSDRIIIDTQHYIITHHYIKVMVMALVMAMVMVEYM